MSSSSDSQPNNNIEGLNPKERGILKGISKGMLPGQIADFTEFTKGAVYDKRNEFREKNLVEKDGGKFRLNEEKTDLDDKFTFQEVFGEEIGAVLENVILEGYTVSETASNNGLESEKVLNHREGLVEEGYLKIEESGNDYFPTRQLIQKIYSMEDLNHSVDERISESIAFVFEDIPLSVSYNEKDLLFKEIPRDKEFWEKEEADVDTGEETNFYDFDENASVKQRIETVLEEEGEVMQVDLPELIDSQQGTVSHYLGQMDVIDREKVEGHKKLVRYTGTESSVPKTEESISEKELLEEDQSSNEVSKEILDEPSDEEEEDPEEDIQDVKQENEEEGSKYLKTSPSPSRTQIKEFDGSFIARFGGSKNDAAEKVVEYFEDNEGKELNYVELAGQVTNDLADGNSHKIAEYWTSVGDVLRVLEEAEVVQYDFGKETFIYNS